MATLINFACATAGITVDAGDTGIAAIAGAAGAGAAGADEDMVAFFSVNACGQDSKPFGDGLCTVFQTLRFMKSNLCSMICKYSSVVLHGCLSGICGFY